MRKKGLLLVLFSFLVMTIFAGKPIKVVVLDAGHGGNDPGAIGITGVKEKDITLILALKVGKMLETFYPNVKVIYTRTTDVFIPLNRRAQIANEQHADFFMSIHCNSATNSSSYGTETFVMGMDKSAANLAVAQKENASILLESNTKENYGDFDPTSPEAYIIFSLYQNVYLEQSLKVASTIQSEFKNTLHKVDRGVKQAPLLVLWRTAMPSILVETGFLSNKTEEAYLNSAKGQEELAKAMFRGIEKMIKENAVAEQTVTPIQENRTSVQVDTNNVKIDTTDSKLVIDSTKQVNYKVQFMVINRVVTIDKIPDVEIVKIGNGRYKYYSGNMSTYAEATERLQYISAHGYPDAYIVAFDKNGNTMSIQDAKKNER